MPADNNEINKNKEAKSFAVLNIKNTCHINNITMTL